MRASPLLGGTISVCFNYLFHTAFQYSTNDSASYHPLCFTGKTLSAKSTSQLL